MTPRAAPMTADDRRTALVEATLPLLHQHGRTVTTKQIAEAAGVAEGTIFRVFESKDDLVLAAVERGLDMEPLLAALASIDSDTGDQDLRGRLLDLCGRLQARFESVFRLMSAMGMVGPPRSRRHTEDGRQRAEQLMVEAVAPYADQITCSPAELVLMLRLLTFSGTHPHITDGRLLTPDQIVGTLLDGVLRRKEDD